MNRSERSATEPAVSIVVPVYNEEEAVPPLVRAVREALADGPAWELLLIDDGSVDGTAAIAAAEAERDPHVRLLRLARNYGQTAALQAGFDHARGTVVVSMDGDLQNDPRDIPALLEKIYEGYDLVAGYRVNRNDPFLTRRFPSAVANAILRRVTGVPVRDTGCSLRAYRREVLQRLHLYADLHRFIPAVAAATAGARIAELPVRHHARRLGQSKYGLSRIGKVMVDLIALRALRTFRDRPFLPFGFGAAVAAIVGAGTVAATLIAYISFTPAKAHALVLPGIAAAFIGLAAYLVMLGLIAEVAAERWARTGRPTLPVAQ